MIHHRSNNLIKKEGVRTASRVYAVRISATKLQLLAPFTFSDIYNT